MYKVPQSTPPDLGLGVAMWVGVTSLLSVACLAWLQSLVLPEIQRSRRFNLGLEWAIMPEGLLLLYFILVGLRLWAVCWKRRRARVISLQYWLLTLVIAAYFGLILTTVY